MVGVLISLSGPEAHNNKSSTHFLRAYYMREVANTWKQSIQSATIHSKFQFQVCKRVLADYARWPQDKQNYCLYKFRFVAMLAALSVHHFSPDLNISTTIGWIAMKSFTAKTHTSHLDNT